MSKNKKGESQVEEQKEEIVEQIVEQEAVVEPKEEIVIIYAGESKEQYGAVEQNIKPFKHVDLIDDNQMVWANKKNYQIQCIKSWAVNKGLEIIGIV